MILLVGLSPTVEPARRRAWAVVGYLTAVIFTTLLTTAALRGSIPPFFVQGAGPTTLRQGVLGTADVLFIFSFLIFIGMHFRTKEVFLYWYALALALTSVSLTAFFIQSSVGSPVGWVGRFSQYLAGAYLLVSLVAARRVAHERKTSLDNVLTFSLNSAEGEFAPVAAGSPNAIERPDKDLAHIYLEESADAFYVKDIQGRYLLFNSEAARITGKQPEEVIGKDDYFLFPADEARTVMAGDRKVMDGGHVITYEEVVQTVAGTTTYLSTKGPLFDDYGKVSGLFGIARDITEAKRAEEQLAAQAARLKVLAEASKALDGADRDHEVVLELVVRLVSEALGDVCRIRTLSEDGNRLDLAALHSPDPGLTEIVRAVESPSLDLATDLGPAPQVIRSGEPRFVPVITQDANRVSPTPAFVPFLERFPPHSFIMVPLRAQDRLIGVLSLTRYQRSAPSFTEDDLILAQELADRAAMAIANARLLAQVQQELVERELAEAEIRRLNADLEERGRRRTAQLEAANQELEAFSYSVSHDLRAPLRYISGFSQILAEHLGEAADEKTGHCIETITRSVREMGVLIDDLLQFSRVGRAEMHLGRVDMVALVHEVVDSMAGQESGHRVEVRVGALPPAVGDAALLRQVWTNLLGNAFKYTRPRDHAVVEVGARPAEGETVYFVRDNGVGFDMEYADKLFGVFERLHGSDEFEGTGIGLANVKRIVTRHGGRCSAEAKVNEGATFFFTMPEGSVGL